MSDDYFLGINFSHDASVCVMHEGNIIFYQEGERLNHEKYTSEYNKILYNAFHHIKKCHKNPNIHICFTSTIGHFNYLKIYYDVLTKHLTEIGFNNTFFYYVDHHDAHSSLSFYNSGFKESLCFSVDGSGFVVSAETHYYKQVEQVTKKTYNKTEYLLIGISDNALHRRRDNIVLGLPSSKKESTVEYNMFDKYFKFVKGYTYFEYCKKIKNLINDNKKHSKKRLSYGVMFKCLSRWALKDMRGAGKVMGLSAYGKKNYNIVIDLFDEEIPQAIWGEYVWEWRKKLVKNIPAEDLAYKIQTESVKAIIKYLEKIFAKYDCDNMCLSGGFFYNIIANYAIIKHFPDKNFYFEPNAGDSGVSVGAAKKIYHEITDDKTIRPIQTLYLGDQANYERKLEEGEIEYNITPKEIAQLIADRHVVAIYQGRAEAGPRALGNRSILYDPRDPNGRDVVNTIKKREWYRPFAGTVMEEHQHEWFDMAGLNSSPFMMFAIECQKEKRHLVPALQHNDGTSRIQTLNKEQNKNYYDLINEFYKLTGIPMVLNTSFNLAGDTMVDNMQDALWTCRNGNIPYLYCPERKMIIDFTGRKNV